MLIFFNAIDLIQNSKRGGGLVNFFVPLLALLLLGFIFLAMMGFRKLNMITKINSEVFRFKKWS